MFSVIIPTLNRSDKLRRALDSVAGQIGETPEIIVIDDASAPDEAARIAAMVGALPNAKLIRLDENGGPARARNIGVAASSGRYIAFLDSDDWWVPERLSHHRAALADPAVVASYNSARVTRSGVSQATGLVGRAKPRTWSMPVALAGFNFVGGCSLVCVKREAFDRLAGFDTALPSCEDWHLWLRLSALGEFRFVDEALGYYDVGPHIRLTTSQQRILDGHQQVFAFARSVPQTPAEIRYVQAVHRWVMAEVAVTFGDTRRAMTGLIASLLTRPTRLAIRRTPALLSTAASIALGLSEKEGRF
ncbi:MAG: glycosyl transferase family 2 [Sphingomonas bacterium]|nr:glycosyl transferase family 2 [Sphingomonas bacterium]